MKFNLSLIFAVGAVSMTLAGSASAQCVLGGPGGAFPGAGAVTGVWNSSLPTAPLISSLAVVVPAGATVLNSVRLNGLTHTWAGDVQIVLQDPSGALHNVLVTAEAGSPTGGGCASDYGGNYQIVDPLTGNSCAGNVAVGCPGGLINPGVYIQGFSSWVSGSAGVLNTPLESIPISSGLWTLYLYDWYPPFDNGTLVDWDLCFGTPSAPAPTGGPQTTCVTGGAGGTYPAPGAVEGTYPTNLPTGELSAPLAVTVPAGSTKILGVKLNGFAHSWASDSQIVLQSPGGQLYNVFVDQNGTFGGGCGDNFSGDYTFVDGTLGLNECGTPANTFACGSGTVPPGSLRQNYGIWVSGALGINNVDLQSIPVASGTWNLIFYDWYLAGDNGSLASWDLCFDGPPAPVVYCTAKSNSLGCIPTS